MTPPMKLNIYTAHHIFIEDLVAFISNRKNIPTSRVRELIPNAFYKRSYALKATSRKSWCQEVTQYMRDNNIDVIHTKLSITAEGLRKRK